jgi:1-phosphatidylinositol phosphodiesterase
MTLGRRWLRGIVAALAVVSGMAALPAPAQALTCGTVNWMQCKSDNLLVSRLTLPGTHDSGAIGGGGLQGFCGVGADYARAQDVGLRRQLDMGVRFLDIRFGAANWASNPRLQVFHGLCAMPIYADASGPVPSGWTTVMGDVLGFLNAHPSETVLLSVKDEDGSHPWAFSNLMAQMVTRSGTSRWWLNDYLPTLAQSRGKIVLLRRFDRQVFNVGAGGLNAFNGWPVNTTGTGVRNMVIEDQYSRLTPQRKRDLVASSVSSAHARLQANDYRLSITFTSGNELLSPIWSCTVALQGTPCSITNYSNVLNPYLYDRFPSAGRSGAIVMDRVYTELVQRVVSSNYTEPDASV